MDFVLEVARWLIDPAHWRGGEGIVLRVLEHLRYSVVSIAIAAAIAIPIGLVLGHTGRGGLLAINVTNIGRAIPSFGLVMIAYIALGLGDTPAIIALVGLAIPPMVTNSYVGIRSVDRGVREASSGMGMTGRQMLAKVELPIAMPLVMAGVRTSSVQVVATATIAAFVGLGGLGRYIIDGRASQDEVLVTAGAILVALLSILTEYLLSRLQDGLVSQGVAAHSAEAALEAKMQASAR